MVDDGVRQLLNPPDGVSLDDLLVDLAEPALASLLTSPTSAPAVQRVIILDPMSATDARRGDLVLAVGVAPDGPQLTEIVETLARVQAAAIVVRASDHDALADAVATCNAACLSLVGVRLALSWERIYSLLQASLGSRSLRFTDRTDRGIPLGDMFELASALSRLVGGPTILEDAFFRVIGYSAYAGESDRGRQSAILSRQVPPEWLAYLRDRGILDGLRSTDEVFRLNDGPVDARPRLITSVRAGIDQIGVIWVAQGDDELDDSAVERLRQGRRMAEPHFRRYLAIDRLGDRHRSEVLRAFLESREPDDAISDALAFSESMNYSLLAIKADEEWANVGRFELVPALLETFDRRAAVTTLDGVVYGLVPITRPSDLQRLKGLAEQCIGAAPGGRRRDTGDSVAAISSPRLINLGAAPAREEIRALLSLATDRKDRPCLLAGWEAEAEVLTRRAGNLLKGDGRFRYTRVQRLIDHDLSKGSHLTETLSTYLTHMHNVGRTSELLGIHHTTTRYRLQQISRVSGLQLDEAEHCLAALFHLLAVGTLPTQGPDSR